MDYKDRIYGQIEIKKPVILELIKSPSLQRLKGVDQAGYFKPFFPGNCFSRFEHSLGVFSHCLDYALNEGSAKRQDHADKQVIQKVVKHIKMDKKLALL